MSAPGHGAWRKSIIGASDGAATVAKAVWEQLADLHANTSGCRPPPLAGSGVGSHGQQVLVLLRRSENSTWFQAGDRAELLEGRFSMCKFESGSLLFRVARCIMDYAAGGVVGSLHSRVVDRLEGQREELEVGLGDLPPLER